MTSPNNRVLGITLTVDEYKVFEQNASKMGLTKGQLARQAFREFFRDHSELEPATDEYWELGGESISKRSGLRTFDDLHYPKLKSEGGPSVRRREAARNGDFSGCLADFKEE